MAPSAFVRRRKVRPRRRRPRPNTHRPTDPRGRRQRTRCRPRRPTQIFLVAGSNATSNATTNPESAFTPTPAPNPSEELAADRSEAREHDVAIGVDPHRVRLVDLIKVDAPRLVARIEAVVDSTILGQSKQRHVELGRAGGAVGGHTGDVHLALSVDGDVGRGEAARQRDGRARERQSERPDTPPSGTTHGSGPSDLLVSVEASRLDPPSPASTDESAPASTDAGTTSSPAHSIKNACDTRSPSHESCVFTPNPACATASQCRGGADAHRQPLRIFPGASSSFRVVQVPLKQAAVTPLQTLMSEPVHALAQYVPDVEVSVDEHP